MTEAKDNALVVAVNLDPHQAHGCNFELPLWRFGLDDHATIAAEDLIHEVRFSWAGKIQHVWLDPAHNPFHLAAGSARPSSLIMAGGTQVRGDARGTRVDPRCSNRHSITDGSDHGRRGQPRQRRFGPLDWLDRIRLAGPNTDVRQGLERDILPKYLTRCRWYAAKDAGPPLVEIIDLVTCRSRSTILPWPCCASRRPGGSPSATSYRWLLLGLTRATCPVGASPTSSAMRARRH